MDAAVVTPGLIDAHSVVGLTGYLNQRQDQEQLDRSEAIQPELRALDAYDPQERLVEWLRGFGITTLHTGHAPGEIISGQTMIVKTAGRTVDEAVMVPTAMVAATLGDWTVHGDGKAPGTRSKAVAMLRGQLIKAQAYVKKQDSATSQPATVSDVDGPAESTPTSVTDVAGAATTQPEPPPTSSPADEGAKVENSKKPKEPPERDLRMETLARVLRGEIPMLVTVHRAADIITTLRLAREFNIRVVLDGACEAYLVKSEIKAAGVPVILHPTMMRSGKGLTENASMETASILKIEGIRFALQSGMESYVPKTRVVLFEAGIAAANGLLFEDALAAITIDAARILGVDNRIGSLETGKDADIALYDGDPFEYTSHCVGVIINGKVVSETAQ
ncbi:MAG: amidohydrolase family protein [Phycisphaerae bacterium]|nr:amidohydrolase family protein [Phycisphaerae bacterium]